MGVYTEGRPHAVPSEATSSLNFVSHSQHRGRPHSKPTLAKPPDALCVTRDECTVLELPLVSAFAYRLPKCQAADSRRQYRSAICYQVSSMHVALYATSSLNFRVPFSID